MNALNNSCRFKGNVGKDPEIRYSPSGSPVVSISLAVNKFVYDSKEKKTKRGGTQWIRLTAFGALGEHMAQLVTKGATIMVDTEYSTKEYIDKNKVKRISHDFIVREFEMVKFGAGYKGGEGDNQVEDAAGESEDDSYDDTEYVDEEEPF